MNHSPSKCKICGDYHCLAGCVPVEECKKKCAHIEQAHYYITYRNCGKPERTPVLTGSATKNVQLLKVQGATAIRVHSL